MGGHWSKEKPLSVTLDLGVMNLKSNLVQSSCNQYRKNEIMPSAATRMDLEMVILSEVSQRKTNFMIDHLYVESKNNGTNEPIYKIEIVTDVENKLMVTKGERREGQTERFGLIYTHYYI